MCSSEHASRRARRARPRRGDADQEIPELVYCSGGRSAHGPLKLKTRLRAAHPGVSGLMIRTATRAGAHARRHVDPRLRHRMWTAIGAHRGGSCIARRRPGLRRRCVTLRAARWMKGHYLKLQSSGQMPGAIAPGAPRGAVRSFETSTGPSSSRRARSALFASSPRSSATRVGDRRALCDERSARRASRGADRRVARDSLDPDEGRVDRCARSGRRAVRDHQRAAEAIAHPHAQALGIAQPVPGDEDCA